MSVLEAYCPNQTLPEALGLWCGKKWVRQPNFGYFPHIVPCGPNLHVKPLSLPVEYCVMYLRSYLLQ
jgi:hypothetical protein